MAIIAHVDHGKTTLVDQLIAQTGLVRENQQVQDCILDSNDLERERGITILSKNISVRYKDTKINLIDTPGHADFGGEVERVLRMADGVLLLVDSFEGPMPQTRFVLRKALEANLLPIVVVNKMDRPDARPDAVVDEVFDLMGDLGGTEEQLDFPSIFASGRAGWSSLDSGTPGTDLIPLLDTILERIPAPQDDPSAALQMQVTSLDWSNFTGRIAIGRVYGGTIERGKRLAISRADGKEVGAQPKKLLLFEGLGRVETDRVEAGDICALEGLEDVSIGDTIGMAGEIEPMHRIEVDAPTISMTFRVNDGPLAGQEGDFVTSRQLRDRLMREKLKNVALRVEDTDRPEVLEVSGRGLLHLGILIEEMRREGYEFCVGKPRVIYREVDGKIEEPIELATVEVPDATSGKVIELMGRRRGEMASMEPKEGIVHLEFKIPARGLLGVRTRLLNLTQGEAVLHHVFDGYGPHQGDIQTRSTGSMISSEPGEAVHYAMANLKDRGTFFVPVGMTVFEGMVVGEHAKENDIAVNVCKGKKLTNIRTTSADKKLFLPPPRELTVEDALEFIEEDELVEITPKNIRLRKILLKEADRRRESRAKKGAAR